jgi:hypothetical protein
MRVVAPNRLIRTEIPPHYQEYQPLVYQPACFSKAHRHWVCSVARHLVTQQHKPDARIDADFRHKSSGGKQALMLSTGMATSRRARGITQLVR